MFEWIILAVVVVLVIWVVMIYNRLVTMRNAFRNAFAQIDVQLTRRHDLIPNLVEVASKYMAHERETLEAVIQARNQAASSLKQASADPTNLVAMGQLAGDEGMLAGTLGRLFALSEAYPDLKANQNMMQLSEELTATENRVAFARQSYNDSVMQYNNSREVFPNNLVAGPFSFAHQPLLEIENVAMRQAPKVAF